MLQEFDLIVLTQDILYRGKHKTVLVQRPGHKILPRGSVGTVVEVAASGSATVEFFKPLHCLITVEPDELTVVETAV